MILATVPPKRFDAERKRRHIQQQHLFGRLRCAGQNIGLHRRTQRDNFIGIQLDVRLLAARREMEEIVDQLAHRGNARRAANQHDFINLLGRDAGISSACLHGPTVRLEHRLDQLLEHFARNLALIAIAVGQFDIEAARRARDES